MEVKSPIVKKKNRNTPCRRRRNARRAEEHRRKMMVSVGIQTDLPASWDPTAALDAERISKSRGEPFRKVIPVDHAALKSDFSFTSSDEDEVPVPVPETRKKKRFCIRNFLRGKKKKAKTTEDKVEASSLHKTSTRDESENIHDQEQKKSLSDNPARETSHDPVREMYDNIENTMRLSRLEERNNLITALRQIVRHKHPKGKFITFSSPEAVDRMELRSINLPTDPEDLWDLVNRAYHRRGEDIELEGIYRDFVLSHGRVTLDPKKEWPHSHVHTYHP